MSDNTQAKALEVFGADRQVDKCIEELGELATVLVKYRHGEASAADVIDELADVYITTGTIAMLFDRDAVKERVAVKLSRLSQLVADQVATAKPEPKPEAVPIIRWHDEGNTMALYLHHKQIGMVELHRSGRWIGDPFGKASATSDDKGKAMRHVERVCGLPEVPLWK